MSTSYFVHHCRNAWRYAWPFFPGTFVGLLIGLVGLASGSRFVVQRGVLEISDGAARWYLRFGIPGMGEMPAMTFGHVILGRDQATIDQWRDHEHVHVRQYECWGPLLIPVLLLTGLWQAAVGGDPYYDNPFEREAYAGAQCPHEIVWRPRRHPSKSTT